MNKQKKAIVFIEASSTGAGEVTAKYAKRIGLETILVSINPSMYSISVLRYMDELIACDTNSIGDITNELESIQYKIKGITTTNDLFVPQASLVANKFNLASMNYNDVLNVRNKYKMRLKLSEQNCHLNPRFEVAKSKEDVLNIAKELGFPLIFKPQNSNDSIDVNLINNEVEALKYWRKSERWNKNEFDQKIEEDILVEEYVQGEEFSMETYQFFGEEIQLIGITKKIMTGVESNSFVELGLTFPHDELNDKVFPKISKALSDLGINCGVIHTEFRIVNGEIKIIEINPRLMGDMAGSHLMGYSLGSNPAHLVVDIAINEKKEFKSIFRKKATLFGVCLPENGIFYGIENEEEILEAGAIAIGAIKPIGEKYYYPPKSNIDVVARIITLDETFVKATEKAERISELIKFKEK